MKGEDTTYRDAISDVELGWAPWVLAATYFPVYIVLDFVFGSRIADEVGLLQSVAVGVVSLTISAFVVLLFVLESIRRAARPRHGLGSSKGRLGRGLKRLVSPLTGALLTIFVVARNGVAMLLEGLWSVTAAVIGAVRAVVDLLVRPVVFLGALAARPLRAATSRAAGSPGSDVETAEDDVETAEDPFDTAVDRTDIESETTSSPVERALQESAVATGSADADETPGAAGTTGAVGASHRDDSTEDSGIAASGGADERAGADEAAATEATDDPTGDDEDDGESQLRRAGEPSTNGGMIFPAQSATDGGEGAGDGDGADVGRFPDPPADATGTGDVDAAADADAPDDADAPVDGSSRSSADRDGATGAGGTGDGETGDGETCDGTEGDDTDAEWPDEWIPATDGR